MSETLATRTVHAACPHDCPDTCAMRVTVAGQRIVKIQGDPDHPPTHGALCTKVSRYAERTDHPERVLTPLKRVGPKGAGQFQPVSWDEALGDIAGRLAGIAARDPQAILPYSYAGTMGLVQGESIAARFFHRLGASLLDRTICASAGGEALQQTYGGKLGMHLEHFAESRLILIWGSNSIASNLHFWTFAQAAKRAGAKLIAIDPRRTETAEKCHQHIALRPGTDGALALGLMHELIANDWLDPDYLERHVEGWPALRERALQWPAERVAEVCGLTADEVRGLARDYATTAPAAIRLNYGMQRVRGGGNAVRLIALLPCLTGAWRHRAGGLLLSASGWFKPVRNDAWLQRPDLLAGRTPRTINMSTIGDDLLREASPVFGPKIEALVVYNSNPVAVAPESSKVVAGFRRDDLFTVVLEHFLTDTADHADYVLPATTQLEHWDAHTSYGHTYALINEPAIAPRGRGAVQQRDLPAAGGAARLHRAVLQRRRRHAGAARLHRRRGWRHAAPRRLGQAGPARGTVRPRRFPHTQRQGRGLQRQRALAGPCAEPRERAEHAGTGCALPAGDDLATGAQLPQLHLRECQEPARHRGRAAAGDASG